MSVEAVKKDEEQELAQECYQPQVGTVQPTSLFVLRPGFGSAGKAITLNTNHFSLSSIPDGIIYQYDLAIGTTVVKRPPRVNMEVFGELAKVVPELANAAYDGQKNIYSMQLLKDTQIDLILPGAKKAISITVRCVQKISTEPLKQLISGKGQASAETFVAIAAINTAIRHSPISRLPFNSRSFFTSLETYVIGKGVEMWRGWYSSVRPTLSGLQLNLDTSAAAMYKALPVIDLAVDVLMLRQVQDLVQAFAKDPANRRKVEKFLKTARVSVNLGSKPVNSDQQAKVFGIKSISDKGADKYSFQLDVEGAQKTMTVAQYFKQQYNITLRFPSLPCLTVKTGVAYPMELCSVLPGQLYKHKLDPDQTRKCLEFTTRKPDERLATIRNGLSVLSAQTSPQVKGMGITLGSNFTKVPARILPTPTIQYNNSGKVKTARVSNGSWNLLNAKFCSPVTVTRWSVLVFGRQDNPRFTPEHLKGFMTTFVTTLEATGITFKNKRPPLSWGNPYSNVDQSLRAAGDAAVNSSTVKGRPELILCILPDAGTDLYASIKRWGDVAMGVTTQCLLLKNLTKPRGVDQYCANVAMKVNAKLGGVNASLAPKTHPMIDAGDTLFLAIDVVHPEPGSTKPSIAAFVSSQDKAASNYFAQTYVMPSRVEVVNHDGIKNMTTEALKRFFTNTKVKPSKIIFLRDGVGEGMYAEVLQKEIASIKAACAALEKGYNPKLTACVVGKRHHVRFFPQSANDADRSGNAPAGTVVDSGIAHPTEFDFWLLSHGGLLGTSRPAHYVVVKDENNFSADSFQKLMFSLTHVYARATRSVSIPPVVYYADIVASRARFHFGTDVDFGSDTQSMLSMNGPETTFESYVAAYRPIQAELKYKQYFM